MKLTDLTENQRRTLRALNELKTASRHEIVERSQQSAKLISAMLNRLEAMGLVEKPETHGSGWTISPSGRALFSDKLPAEYPAQPMIKEPPTQTLETPDVKIDSNHLESAPFIYAARSRQAASMNFSASVRASPGVSDS